MKIVFTLLIINIFSFAAQAQIFSGAGGGIPDNGNSVDFTINVSGLPNSIDSLFGLEELCLNIVHTWDSDLDISLIAPDGSQVTLVSGIGGGDDDFINTCLNQHAANSIQQGAAPFTGQFRPLGQLGLVNNGQNPNGIWTLHIQDTYPFADTGTLQNWSINFTNNPATVFRMTSSNLPIVKINTNGQTIGQGTKIMARMDIIDNGPGIRNYVSDSANSYRGHIGIEIRGHSSAGFPQKQFNVETRDSIGNNINVALLGLPIENDWVLYAPYNDKSLMRNSLTYELGRQMGRYASRGRYCEVLLNGEYKGVYTFFEKIKKDNNRVNVAGLTLADTSGMELTGGYICSVDWADGGGWFSNYPPDMTNPDNGTMFYQYIYPKDDVILPQQEAYIQRYVDSFETALLSTTFTDSLTGWRKYANEGTFIDFFLMNELSKNVDGYRLSTFFHKKKDSDGGKLQMGPLWDFNLAWHNADYCNNESSDGWAYLFTDYCSFDYPFWWRRLNEDSVFQHNVRCRWEELRTNVLDTTNIFGYMDSLATMLDESQQRHYGIYAILGTYVWPNPAPIANSFQEEIRNMKNWIIDRINFMDANLPGTGICSVNTGLAEQPQANNELNLYPNPSDGPCRLFTGEIGPATIHVYDAMGRIVYQQNIASGPSVELDLSFLAKGVYLIRLSEDKKAALSIKFVKR